MSIKKFDNSDDNITSSDIKYILDVNKKAIEIYLAVEQQNEELQREITENKVKTEESLKELKAINEKLIALDKSLFRLIVVLSGIGLTTITYILNLLITK